MWPGEGAEEETGLSKVSQEVNFFSESDRPSLDVETVSITEESYKATAQENDSEYRYRSSAQDYVSK